MKWDDEPTGKISIDPTTLHNVGMYRDIWLEHVYWVIYGSIDPR